jgi:hypothetical protein
VESPPRPAAADRPVTLDLRTRAADVEHVGAALDALAADLRRLWAAALADGDFDEITRLAEASQAVHSAVIALRPDDVLIAPTEL